MKNILQSLTFLALLSWTFTATSQSLYWEENGESSTSGLAFITKSDPNNITTNVSDWFVYVGNTANQQLTTQGTLTLTDYPNSGIGNAFRTSTVNASGAFKNNNVEYQRRVGNSDGSQSLYMSMILKVFQIRGDYSTFPIGFAEILNNDSDPSAITREWGSRLLIDYAGTAPLSGATAFKAADYYLGITKNGTDRFIDESKTYSGTDDLEVLVVLKLTMDGDDTNANDILELYSATSLPSDEPITWDLTTSTGQDFNINSAFIREKMDNAASLDHFVDFGYIRVADSWAGLFGSTSVDVTDITITSDAGQTEVIEGTTLQMNAAVLPANATDPSITWSTTNGTGTGTIDQNGLFTAGTVGTVTATATSNDGSGISGNFELEVISIPGAVDVTDITITSDAGQTEIIEGATLQMNAAVLPVNATDPSVTWSTMNGTGTGTIDVNGLFTAGTVGTVTATATSNDGSGISGNFELEVINIPGAVDVTDITITSDAGQTEVIEGTTLQMNAAVLPVNATDPSVTWSTMNGTGTGTIDVNGLFTAGTVGTVTATATSNDGSGISGNFELEVSSIPEPQNLVWTGEIDNDFFNELNWIIEGTEDNPLSGTMSEGVAINANLTIDNAVLAPLEAAQLVFSSGSTLNLSNTTLELGSISEGVVTVNNASTLILHSSTPLEGGTNVNLEDSQSWIKMINVDPVDADAIYLNKIKSQGNALILNDNVRINQYYFGGALIRLKDSNHTPLMLFDTAGQSGDSFEVRDFDIYARNELGAFDNKVTSFRLERGYMATMAIYQNGTGKSEVYIASEEALVLDLPQALDNTVSFIRVMPWNWVTKKGASKFKNVGTTWTYNWSRDGESLPNLEYAPMSWGGNGASSGAIAEYLAMENVTHLLSFNESDNCNGQSGQYGDLCQIEVAVPLHQNLMKTGLRLASPSPRENGPLPGNWLSQFRDLAVETDVRYDVLGVHWYDWANGPVSSPFADPQEVFDRFKNYLDRVYEEHGMPIWITEFNANANRDISVHRGFLELALPYLESLDFIERYDYFEPNPEVAGNRDDIEYPSFYDEDGNITPFGVFYRDFESTPSIPEPTYAGSGLLSGLDGRVGLSMEVSTTAIQEGESLTITFTTDRTVAAPESFNVEVNLDAAQYTLSTDLIEIPEGGNTAEIILTAVDDDLVEELLNGTINLTNLSGGIEWLDSPISFSIESEDIEEEEEEIILSVADDIFSLTLYPNPTKRYITFDTTLKIDDLAVITLDGRIMTNVSHQINTLDLGDVEAGVYIIKVVFENGTTMNKLVHKH